MPTPGTLYGKKARYVTCLFQVETVEELDKYARKNNLSRSVLIREAVDRVIEEIEQEFGEDGKEK